MMNDFGSIWWIPIWLWVGLSAVYLLLKIILSLMGIDEDRFFGIEYDYFEDENSAEQEIRKSSKGFLRHIIDFNRQIIREAESKISGYYLLFTLYFMVYAFFLGIASTILK